MKAFIALALALVAGQASAQANAPVSILGYAIGQKLEACPQGSQGTRKDFRWLCQLGPATLAGASALEHSIVLFNGEVIGALVRLGDHEDGIQSRILADLQERLGDPDRAYSKPDLKSYVWVRGSVVTHFDAIAGLLSVSDVIKTEVAKLRAAPSNQFDF